MSDPQRTEMLAEMGLRLILAAYEAHPNPMLLETQDAFGLRNVKEDYFIDRNYRQRRISGAESRLVAPLIDCMIADSVFRGRQAGSGSSLVTLAAHVRHSLREPGNGHTLKIAELKHKLERAALHSETFPPGTFTVLAREIGFEP